MKIIATSCADPKDWPVQQVWTAIRSHAPDHLVLLGDQIYMDYGIGANPPLGRPASNADVDFAAAMYERYAAQWAIMRASGLLDDGLCKVHGIWDDHDFAWNNSFGVASGAAAGDPGKLAVPPRKQQIARRCFRQFFQSLHQTSYPANSLTSDAAINQLAEDLSKPVFHSDLLAPGAAQGTVDLGGNMRLLLTDGRSFRTAPGVPVDQRRLLGDAQSAWLATALRPDGINIVASGSTLDSGGEPWSNYGDYQKLRALLDASPRRRTLVLSGDIHNTDMRAHHGPNLIELVASGAARPHGNLFRQDCGNFVVLDLSDAQHIAVLMQEGERQHPRQRRYLIDRAQWSVSKA